MTNDELAMRSNSPASGHSSSFVIPSSFVLRHLFHSLLVLETTKADRAAARAGGSVMTICGAHHVWRIGIRSAAQDAVLAVAFRSRGAVAWSIAIIRMPGVEAPLPNVAMHVVKTPGVGKLFSDRRVFLRRVFFEPRVPA